MTNDRTSNGAPNTGVVSGDNSNNLTAQGEKKAIVRYSDPSDAYANEKQLYLSFFHVASGREVNFKAFVESYNETFNSDWNQEQVFGRPDPISTFRFTKRTLNVGWAVPAATLGEAQANLQRCNLLSKFMYPAYEVSALANTIAKPPLMRIAFANLIRNAANGPSPSAREAGLLGTVGSLSITPSFGDEGFFDPDTATLYPKLITINIDFSVLHEHDVGWMATHPEGEDSAPGFGFDSPELRNYPFRDQSPPPPLPEPVAQDAVRESDSALPEGSEVEGDTNDAVRQEQQAGVDRMLEC